MERAEMERTEMERTEMERTEMERTDTSRCVPTGTHRYIQVYAPKGLQATPLRLSSHPLAPYPSGKGKVCKTFIRRFESGRRLNQRISPLGERYLI